MVIKTKGVVIKQRNIGERDAIITILTGDLGLIEASARGVKSIKSKLQSGAQMLSYSDFTLFKGKSNYIINDSESIESFYNIRLDVEKLSLASYFCEVIQYAVTAEENQNDVLRLLLNSLYVLSSSLRSDLFIKTVFEFKFMCITGYLPQMDSCGHCGNDDVENGVFLLTDGVFVCKNCAVSVNDSSKAEINENVIKALIYIAQNDSNKIFSLHIGENTLKYISRITEFYLIYHCEHNFKSLDFYKNISNKM